MRAHRISVLFVAAIGCSSGGSTDQPSSEVLGVFDGVDAEGHALGWALVPSFTTHPLETALYCDGDAKTGTLVYTVRANKKRPDVAVSTGIDGNHGWEFDAPEHLRDGQPHELHMYGIGPAGLVELTGSPKTIQLAGTGTGNEPRAEGSDEVSGYLDAIDQNGGVGGWTLVPSFTSHPIQVAVFADGDAKTGKLLFTNRANKERPDLAEAFGTTHHGYTFWIPDELMDDKPHTLAIYGMGPLGFTELGNSKKGFMLPSALAKGAVDGIDDKGIATGWALVPSVAPGAVDVDIYLDDPNGEKLAIVHADQPRPDVNQATGIAGDHGFSFAIPDELRDEQDHKLFMVAIGPRGVASIGDAQFNLKRLVSARKGIVRKDGRNFVDDDGAFYPLGGTLFWAMWGWKYDQARLKDNIKFLGKHKFDYMRILAEVDWMGQAIDPGWTDYSQVLGELIDYAYAEAGLRTEITIIGGGNGVDVMGLAQTIAGVVNNGRRHKILDIEVANESYQRPVSLQTMRQVGAYLMQTLPNQLVALSSAEGLGAYVPNSTDWIADTQATYLQPGTANMYTIHMDRTQGDLGWREVRQPWDWKDFTAPVSHNEPIGPRSSVAEEVDPVRLAMLRAVGLINGVGAFVLHNGAGVFGKVDPVKNRPANLWEVPGIDAIMDAVRNIDAFIPAHAGDGQHWNNAWTGNPWVVDAFWGDGADHGVNRNYTVAIPGGWISTVAGVKNYAVFTARNHSRVEIFDVLLGKQGEVELQAGQTFTLTPVSTDDHGLGAFIVIGHYL